MNAAELLLNGQPDAVALIEGKRQVTYREVRLAVRQADALTDTRVLRRSAWLAGLASTWTDDTPAVEVEADAPCFMLFSSGTTGKPKGVVHAHRCVANAHIFARDVLGATHADRFISTSKLFFAYPIANSLFAGLRLGASVVLDPGWPNSDAAVVGARQRADPLLQRADALPATDGG